MSKIFLTNIDLKGNELENARIDNVVSLPTGLTSNDAGRLVYHNGVLKVWIGNKWSTLTAAESSLASVTVQAGGNGDLKVTRTGEATDPVYTVEHNNTTTAKSQGLYPIAIDKFGHITSTGTVIDLTNTYQAKLNTAQMNAVNSGITSSKVSTYDGYQNQINNKQDKLTEAQLNAANSTITLAKVQTYDNYGTIINNAESILNKKTTLDVSSADYYPTCSAVKNAIDALPAPMVFKGTLGTGGTITSLPTPTASTEGDTYKVITNGTYAGQAAKQGDMFICGKPASTYEWVYVPSADETFNDTWRAIQVNNTSFKGSAITTGPINFVNGSNVTLTTSGNNITISATDTTYNNATSTVSGLMSSTDKNKLDNIHNNATQVSFTRNVSTGTKIGTITINGTGTDIYAPDATGFTITKTFDITGDATTTSFNCDHNLNTKDVIIQVYDKSSYESVIVDEERTTVNRVIVKFNKAPIVGENYRVVIIGTQN